MKNISMIQNTDEWRSFRNERLGASEANIIMGVSKFKTPLQLWEQKTGKAQEENKEPNFIQEKGHRIEAKCRHIAEMIFNTEFPPIVAIHEEMDFLMASLDGYSEEQNLNWECKYAGKDDFEKVCNGEVLEQYYPQIQQQLFITGAEKCILFVCKDNKESKNPDFPYQYTYLFIEPDFKYIKEELLPAMIKFWEMVKTKTPPGANINDVVDMSQSNEMAELLYEYKEIKGQLDAFAKEEKQLKDKIFKIAVADKVICNGVKITKTLGKDKKVIDYDTFLTENNIEIPEQYISVKPGITTKRITFPTKKGQ